MCIYIQTVPLCGHPPPTILSYASCANVLSQLMRITEPEAWGPGGLDRVPFEMSDECDPGPDNTYVLYSGDYCGWECRNSACRLASDLGGLGVDLGGGGLLPAYTPGPGPGPGPMPGGMGQYGVGGGAGGVFGGGGPGPMVMGMPGAEYGSERLGIGWRTA